MTRGNDSAFRLAQRAAAGFGRPPRALRSLHRPLWLGRLWLAVERWAHQPVVVRPMRGYVCIEVLGLFRYFRRDNGTFDVYGRRFGDPARRWVEIEDDNAVVIGVPLRDSWERALAAIVESEGPRPRGREGPAKAYRTWAARQLAGRVRREFDLWAIRREIAAALDVREVVVRLARRIPRTCDPGDDRASLRVDLYNRVWSSYETYRKLAEEAPNLLPLFGVLSALPGFPIWGEPVQRLRDFLWVRGVSPAGWRIVAKAPARLWVRHLGFYRDPIGEAALDLIRLVDLLRGRDAPPPWFLRALLAMRGNYQHRLDNVVVRWGPHMRTLQRLALLVEQADDVTRAAMREELHGILAWVVECAHAVPPNAIRHYDWSTFVRRADEWRRIDRQRAMKSTVRWPVPFERMSCGAFEAVVLGNAFELWEEGEAMRHCVAGYDIGCAEGKHLVVSLRAPGRKRPLCTALYERGADRWELVDAAAFANARPSNGVWRALAHVGQRLDAVPAWRSDDASSGCLTLWLERLEADVEAHARAAELAKANPTA